MVSFIMARNRNWLVTSFLICIVLFSLCRIEVARSFITREYTLQEVLDDCTNVAFGRAESVDQKKQRVIVKLEENVKGKSGFSHIKINAAVGQIKRKQTSPAMLMAKFRVGLPVIIFYKEGSNLQGLGYVSGTWFQIFGTDRPEKNRVWWNFTHLEVFMHRTFSGSTEEFQKVIRKTLAGEKWASAGKDDVKVLVLTGNGAPPLQGDGGEVPQGAIGTAEFLALRKFNRVGKWRVAYQETKDRNLSGLHNAQILWVGVDEIGKDGYHLNEKAEDRIKSFVRRGGVVIVSSQDSDPGKLCGNGWIPEPIEGVEEDARRDFRPTEYAGDIFKSPSPINPGTVYLDDTWTGWSKKYEILATTNDGKNIALATLQYGEGMYLVTALQNETEENAKANAPLMENIIHFSVKRVKA